MPSGQAAHRASRRALNSSGAKPSRGGGGGSRAGGESDSRVSAGGIVIIAGAARGSIVRAGRAGAIRLGAALVPSPLSTGERERIPRELKRSTENRLHHLRRLDAAEAGVEALELDGEALVVDAAQVQQGG